LCRQPSPVEDQGKIVGLGRLVVVAGLHAPPREVDGGVDQEAAQVQVGLAVARAGPEGGQKEQRGEREQARVLGWVGRESRESTQAEGEQDAAQRANKRYKKLLADYVTPAIDPGVAEALDEFVAKKKAAAPDSNI